ncbi:MAG: hypothetical protein DI538_19005 [Azospira oryzae]|jgi:hypothetical protein|nr:MAG: hypothetical protein DI538_19005 [Azospira oryzae]
MDEFFQTVKTAVNKQPNANGMLNTYIVTKIKTLKEKTNLYCFAIENELREESISSPIFAADTTMKKRN